MDRNEMEQRTKSILEEYAKSKLIFLDAVYEAQRAKDDQYKRVMSFHEAHVTQLVKRIRELEQTFLVIADAANRHNAADADLVRTINALNKVALHTPLQLNSPSSSTTGSMSTPQRPDPMLLVTQPHDEVVQLLSAITSSTTATLPLAAVPSAPMEPQLTASATPAAIEAQLLRQTIQRQETDIEHLRKALDVIVNRVQGSLESATKVAVEEILNEASAQNETVVSMQGDPHLQRAAEQRKRDLAAISSAQGEIDRLQQEKAALIVSLRKAEQDVVQMRLKMMERDSSMAIISKRIKTVESKLMEEMATSAARIEAAERLAGEITVKYEAEVRRLRQAIDTGSKERDTLQEEIDHQKALVVEAQDETNEVRKQIEIVREESYALGRASMVPKVDDALTKLANSEAELTVSTDTVRDLRVKLSDMTSQFQARAIACEELEEQLEMCRTELGDVKEELAQRLQHPLGSIPRTPASREQSSNGILTVAPLIDEMVSKTSSDPQYTDTAIRRLSTRLAKVHTWSASSEKAKHPSMAHRVSSAIHDLSAAMLAVANSGLPPPPSPAELKRRQSRRASSAPKDDEGSGDGLQPREDTASSGGGGSAALGSSQQHRRSQARVTMTDEDGSISPPPKARASSFRAFTDEGTVVLAGSPMRRRSSTNNTDESVIDGDGDAFEAADLINTPSSSEDDGDDDVFSARKKTTTTASVGVMCSPTTQERSVQVDALSNQKKAEAAQAQTKRASVKLTAKKDSSLASSAVPSQLPSPTMHRTANAKLLRSDDPLNSDITLYSAMLPAAASPPPAALFSRDGCDALQSLESAARRHIESEMRRAMVDIENSLRVSRVTNEQLTAQQDLRRAGDRLRGLPPLHSLAPFADSLHAETKRVFLGQSRAEAQLRDAVASIGFVTSAIRASAAVSGSNSGSISPKNTAAAQQQIASTATSPTSSPSRLLFPTQVEARDSDTVELFEIAQAYDFAPEMIVDVDEMVPEVSTDGMTPLSVPASKFNRLVGVVHQAQRDIQRLVAIKETLVANHEKVQGQMEVLLNTMDDGGKRLLTQASTLPFFQPNGASSLSSPRFGGGRLGASKRSDESAAEVKMMYELVQWFVLEGQRYIVRAFLPQGRPVAYEGRPPQSQQQVQDRLAAMLECLRHQKEFIVEEAEKRAKRRKNKKTDMPAFLSSPDVIESAALEPPQGSPRGDGSLSPGRGGLDDELELEPLEANALAKKLHRSPRNSDLRPNESEDSSSDEDSPFVPPLVPKLAFPTNPSIQKLELEALVQPLLRALRKRLTAVGLENLLDPELRVGVALALVSEVENAQLPSGSTDGNSLLKEAMRLRWRALRASLSHESTHYVKDDQHHMFFQSMFHSFPRGLLEKLTKDFNRDYAQQFVLTVGEWWDGWSPHIRDLLEAVENRKTDQLRRLIELAEQVEQASLHLNNYSTALSISHHLTSQQLDSSLASQGATRRTPAIPHADDIDLHELAQRAQRKEELIQKQLDHPPVASFSLHTKARAGNAQQRDPSRLPWASRFPPPGNQRAFPPNSLQMEIQDAASLPASTEGLVGTLQRVSPLPTVATLAPPPLYNLGAKKTVSKWEARLPPLK